MLKHLSLLGLADSMQKRFRLITGLSDHAIENTTVIISAVPSMSVIEKHVTLDRNSSSPGDSFSLESGKLKKLCAEAKNAWKWDALGSVDYGRKSSEHGNVEFRRTLCFVKNKRPPRISTTNRSQLTMVPDVK